MTSVWVVDIDRTVADHSHREYLLRKTCVSCSTPSSHDFSGTCHNCGCDIFDIPTNSWKAFTDPHILKYDRPIVNAQEVIHRAMDFGIHVHYITGRQPNARTETQAWLVEHMGFNPNVNKLLMREVDSYTQKKELHIKASAHKENKFRQLMEMCGYTFADHFSFFDDDKFVIQMYSQFGMVYHAPECWDSMIIKDPKSIEPWFNK